MKTDMMVSRITASRSLVQGLLQPVVLDVREENLNAAIERLEVCPDVRAGAVVVSQSTSDGD